MVPNQNSQPCLRVGTHGFEGSSQNDSGSLITAFPPQECRHPVGRELVKPSQSHASGLLARCEESAATSLSQPQEPPPSQSRGCHGVAHELHQWEELGLGQALQALGLQHAVHDPRPAWDLNLQSGGRLCSHVPTWQSRNIRRPGGGLLFHRIVQRENPKGNQPVSRGGGAPPLSWGPSHRDLAPFLVQGTAAARRPGSPAPPRRPPAPSSPGTSRWAPDLPSRSLRPPPSEMSGKVEGLLGKSSKTFMLGQPEVSKLTGAHQRPPPFRPPAITSGHSQLAWQGAVGHSIEAVAEGLGYLLPSLLLRSN